MNPSRSFPVVHRELRSAARRPGTWRTRATIAAGGVAATAFMLVILAVIGVPPAFAGPFLFIALSGIMWIYSMLAGPLLAADCVSRERREGTLGLLFLTDLAPRDIVLGKLAAYSINGVYALVGMIPLLSVVLLLGGISRTLFIESVLVLFNTLFFSLCLAVFISSLCERERTAAGGAILVLLSTIVGPLILAFVLTQWDPDAATLRLITVLGSLSLSAPALAVLWQAGAVGPGPFGMMGWAIPGLSPGFVTQLLVASSALYHVLGWLLLLLAGRILRRARTERPKSAAQGRWQDISSAWRFGTILQRVRHRHRWLDINPFAWLCLRELRKPLLVWVFLAGIGLSFAIAVYNTGSLSFTLSPEVIDVWALFSLVLVRIWWTTESARTMIEERRTGTFELILTTSLDRADILAGQWRALRRQFLAPITILVVLLGLAAATDRDPTRLMAFVRTTLLFLAQLWALAWHAMYLALIRPGLNRAIGEALGNVIVLPLLGFGIVVGLGQLLSSILESLSARFGTAAPLLPTGWFSVALFLGGVAWALVVGMRSRMQLVHHFRELAATAHPVPSPAPRERPPINKKPTPATAGA